MKNKYELNQDLYFIHDNEVVKSKVYSVRVIHLTSQKLIDYSFFLALGTQVYVDEDNCFPSLDELFNYYRNKLDKLDLQ